MANVLICEPVEETRVLIERLVQRMGHEIAGGDSFRDVDVVFYEPASRAGLALARRVQAEQPGVVLVECSSSPARGAGSGLNPFASLLQPFSPVDIRRVLEAAVRGVAPRPV